MVSIIIKVLRCERRAKLFFITLFPVLLLNIPWSGVYAASDDLPKYFVPPPPFSEGIFPCNDCHEDMEPDETPRELDFHEDIKLKHFDGWCFSCHNPKDRDKLRLANGMLIPYNESYYLCGQCHGTIFRDWKAGVHGKRTGFWNGKKMYRLCPQCHWPHAPRFKPLKPLPPPIRPEDLKYSKSREEDIPRNPLEEILKSEKSDVRK
jgi:hypothetical protein